MWVVEGEFDLACVGTKETWSRQTQWKIKISEGISTKYLNRTVDGIYTPIDRLVALWLGHTIQVPEVQNHATSEVPQRNCETDFWGDRHTCVCKVNVRKKQRARKRIGKSRHLVGS